MININEGLEPGKYRIVSMEMQNDFESVTLSEYRAYKGMIPDKDFKSFESGESWERRYINGFHYRLGVSLESDESLTIDISFEGQWDPFTRESCLKGEERKNKINDKIIVSGDEKTYFIIIDQEINDLMTIHGFKIEADKL